MVHFVREYMNHHGVVLGLVIGSAASLAVVGRARRRGSTDCGLLIGAIAIGVTMATEGPVEGTVTMIVGLPLVWAGMRAGAGARASSPIRRLLVVPGAAAVAVGMGLETGRWVLAPFLLVFVLLACDGVQDLPRIPVMEGLGPALFAVSMGGAYACVPLPEDAARCFAAAAPFALVGWPIGAARLGSCGAAVCLAMLAWPAAAGGVRPGSVVGTLAAAGVLPAVGLLTRIRRESHLAQVAEALNSRVVAVAAHVLLVVWCTRVAGRSQSAWVAAGIAAGGFVVAGVALSACRRA